ncbi:MAG: histidine kinase [Rubrivivax sp.]|nr:histidine kinase [Rubrivivax sp.]MCL4697716.1 histidine kinase [Burkholderiaceae bacterium]
MPPAAAAQAPGGRSAARAFVVAWAVFWLLLLTVAVQEHLRFGSPAELWRPLLWEGSSCLVASGLVWLQWRQLPRLDPLLGQPWRWLLRPLVLLPVAAPLFVAAIYAIRHLVHALAGLKYQHPPWPQVLLYESVKFAVFYLLFVAVIFGLRSFAALHAERLRAEANLALAREAQLAQLAQQIEPHFLFNALNVVASAIPEQPALAERLLLRLAALLRAATDLTRRPQVSLGEEVDLLRAYAEIMGQRFADRVSITWQVDQSQREQRVPALILQPLLENAFRHGVERHAGAARIEIEVGRGGAGLVRASVSCNLGALPATPEQGVGLANVRHRLALLYGERASLSLAPRPGGGVVARIEWPASVAAHGEPGRAQPP